MHPFKIVEDDKLKLLMKTGRPEYPLPSATTLSRDVHQVYVHVRHRVAAMLHVSYCRPWCTVADQRV